MPTAIPIAAAAVSGLASMGAAAMADQGGAPELADTNKDALSGYAQRLADEEMKLGQENDFLLRSGGRPITFRNQNRLPQQKMLLT